MEMTKDIEEVPYERKDKNIRIAFRHSNLHLILCVQHCPTVPTSLCINGGL